jgi:branched-chain amino acid transport system substrate-binding protein
MYPLSGPQGIGGREEARGVDLAAAWANSHGGVHGRQIRLVRASAPRADAVPKAMALIRKGGASVVVGSHGSTMSAAAAEVAARDRMLLWETGAVGDLTAGGTKGAGTSFLRLAPMGANLGRAAIDFVHDQWAPAAHAPAHLRYAVAYIDDAYGRSVGLGAVDQIKARGLTLAGTFNYDITKVDFNELARRIGAVKPDVLFVSAYVDDGVALRHATVTAHIPLLTSIGTSSSYCHPVFGQRLGVDAVGLFASDKPDADHLNPDALQPEGRDALAWASDQYRRQYHEAMTAPALSGFSAAVALFVQVLPRAASTAPADVARAAVATKLDLGTLPNGAGLDLSPPGALDAGDNQRAASVIWEWVAPGQRAIVWPKAFATRDLLPLTPVR